MIDLSFHVRAVDDDSTDTVEYSTEVVESPSFVLAGCDVDACPVVVDI